MDGLPDWTALYWQNLTVYSYMDNAREGVNVLVDAAQATGQNVIDFSNWGLGVGGDALTWTWTQTQAAADAAGQVITSTTSTVADKTKEAASGLWSIVTAPYTAAKNALGTLGIAGGVAGVLLFGLAILALVLIYKLISKSIETAPQTLKAGGDAAGKIAPLAALG